MYVLIYLPFKFLYFVTYHGRENEPADEPYILIANHTANVDPILLCSAVRKQKPRYMAKKELFKVPIIGTLVKWLGAYPIDRDGTDIATLRKTIDMLKSGSPIGVFPQGHRYKHIDPRETELKTGVGLIAIRANVKILPCYIKTKNNCLKMFSKTDVYIGKPVTLEELGYDPTAPKKNEYEKVVRNAFELCCKLGDDHE